MNIKKDEVICFSLVPQEREAPIVALIDFDLAAVGNGLVPDACAQDRQIEAFGIIDELIRLGYAAKLPHREIGLRTSDDGIHCVER